MAYQNPWIDRFEGHWAGPAPEDKGFPSPQANDEPWEGQEEFLVKLIAIEEELRVEYAKYVKACNEGENPKPYKHMEGYRGSSGCRLCGIKNGSREFRRYHWVWPTGFRHYIEVHNLKPTAGFIEMIERASLPPGHYRGFIDEEIAEAAGNSAREEIDREILDAIKTCADRLNK